VLDENEDSSSRIGVPADELRKKMTIFSKIAATIFMKL
jgi:hypothetical protein